MTTLSHAPAPVQVRVVRFHVEGPPPDVWMYELPEYELPESEPFHPSPEDLAYDTGWEVGQAGGVFRMPSAWKNDGRGLRYAMGRQAGEKAREARLAFELGEAMGYETGITEPPAGFGPHEAAAYREGFAAAQAEMEAAEAVIERLEASYAEYDAYHDSEVVEAVGVIEARRI